LYNGSRNGEREEGGTCLAGYEVSNVDGIVLPELAINTANDDKKRRGRKPELAASNARGENALARKRINARGCVFRDTQRRTALHPVLSLPLPEYGNTIYISGSVWIYLVLSLSLSLVDRDDPIVCVSDAKFHTACTSGTPLGPLTLVARTIKPF